MYVYDWSKQMRARSFGADRIVGDLKAHFGLEARTLNSQMLTHALHQIH